MSGSIEKQDFVTSKLDGKTGIVQEVYEKESTALVSFGEEDRIVNTYYLELVGKQERLFS